MSLLDKLFSTMNRQRQIRDDGHTKLTRLYNIIVIVLRFFGLTFGGVTIDSKARISTNKWLKLYGYLYVLLIFILDCYFMTINWLMVNEDKHLFTNLPTIVAIIMFFFNSTSTIGWTLLKLCMMITMNGESGRIFGTHLFEIFKSRMSKRNKMMMILILIIWIVNIIIVSELIVLSSTVSNMISEIYSIVFSWGLTMIIFWTLSYVIWTISVYYTQRLDEIYHDITLFVRVKISGKKFIPY